MIIIETIKAILIGIIQGITEWLPISSTGHMILFDQFLKLNVTKEFLDLFLVVIQIGSILAVIYLYFEKLNPFSRKKGKIEREKTFSLWGKVIVGCMPAAIIGFLFDDFIHEKCYNAFVVAAALIVYGVIFIVIENINKKSSINNFDQLSYKMAFLIGVFQVLALIPGTSRSGATIVGAILLGTSRYIAAEYSFFLAIPVMFGAGGYKTLKYIMKYGLNFSLIDWAIMLFGTLVAFIVSVFAIKFLMSYIKKHDFKAFGYYRIILGLIVLSYFLILA